MHRQNPLSVKVRAPSRGLVTRWPSESADLLSTGGAAYNIPGLTSRSAVVASNVRYEDGVTCNAPGYSSLFLTSNLLSSIVAHWNFDELTGTRFDSTFNHNDLTDTAGASLLYASLGSLSSALPYRLMDVTETPGFFNGAALFPSLAPTLIPVILPLPPAPANLIAVAGNATVALSWNAVGVATSYTVKRLVGGVLTAIASSSVNSYTDNTVVDGITYYYVVTAVDPSGESAPSNQAVATPTEPIVLIAVAGNATVALSWNAISAGSIYTVKRSLSAAGPYTPISNPGVNFYTDNSVVNGTTYYYIVNALVADGIATAPSNEVAASPAAPLPPPLVPSAPTGVYSFYSTASLVTINWSASSGATSYNIYVSLNDMGVQGPFAFVANTPSLNYQYYDSSSETPTLYVTAVNSVGESSPSAFTTP